MTYDELNVYLEDVECQKALLMLEAVNEMDSGIYMESGENIIQKVITRLKKLFESIKDWFSKHFRRNKVAKGTTIRMSKSEYKKIDDEYKFSQKLKQAAKNPKNWAVLISAASAVGLGVLAGVTHKKNRELAASNKEKDDTIILKDSEIDSLKEKVTGAQKNLSDAQKLLQQRYEELSDNHIKLDAYKDAIDAKNYRIKYLQDDREKYQNLLASHAENEAKLAKELDELQKMASITEKAGTSNMQHAQKLEAKVEKAQVEDSTKKEIETSNIASKEDIKKYSGDGKGLTSTFADKLQAAMNKAEKKVSDKETKPTKESTNEIMTKYNKLVSDIKSDKLNHGEYRDARAAFRQELQTLITNKTINKSKANELLHGITDAWDGK